MYQISLYFLPAPSAWSCSLVQKTSAQAPEDFHARVCAQRFAHVCAQRFAIYIKIFQIAGRAAAKYDKIASYIATAIQILAEDSEDDTDHEDTPTPPTFTLQLFLDSLFFRLLTFFNGEMNQEMNRVFLRIQIKLIFISSALENSSDKITWIT